METIYQQIAELLNISIEKAIELYPLLREQFIWYKILSSIDSIFSVTWFISGVIGVFVIIFGWIDDVLNETWCSKFIKIIGIVFIISTISSILLGSLTYIKATDFIMIKEFIIK